MNQTADNHIFKFVKNKFTQDSTDFETQLYLCNEAFSVSKIFGKHLLQQCNYFSGLILVHTRD